MKIDATYDFIEPTMLPGILTSDNEVIQKGSHHKKVQFTLGSKSNCKFVLFSTKP